MNIKITEAEHEFLQDFVLAKILIGSKLYGVGTDESDTDYLCIYSKPLSWFSAGFNAFPNIHQFQYTDSQNNIDYIYTTEDQFYQNLFLGDSTINADVCLFSNESVATRDGKLYILRTYKILKAYLGFAKRDLSKGSRIQSICHASRSLYIAECILNSTLPKLSRIQKLYTQIRSKDKDQLSIELLSLKKMESDIRSKLNTLLNSEQIFFYPDFKLNSKILPESTNPIDSLLFKLLNSNNIREFKY